MMMSNTAAFILHIKNIVKKGRDRMRWVLRVFQYGSALMLSVVKWKPCKAKVTQAIEAIQRTFTRLHKFKLLSLHRRRERYIMIQIFKITQHMVPNIDGDT